jgi:hypothetical protein
MFKKWKPIQKHMDLFEKMGAKIQTITRNIGVIKTLTTRTKKQINTQTMAQRHINRSIDPKSNIDLTHKPQKQHYHHTYIYRPRLTYYEVLNFFKCFMFFLPKTLLIT